jgi:hypothetical protein
MEENRLKSAEIMVRIFASYGIHRTKDAISNQMYRLGLKGGGDATPIINYRDLDKGFCAALRAAHPEKETGPRKEIVRDGIPRSFPRSMRSLGSGWQIEIGGE